MSHNYHIGAVKEVEADELTDKTIVLVNGEPRNISELQRTATRINLRLDYLSSTKKWDLSLTKGQKVYILGARRVTGLKEKKYE